MILVLILGVVGCQNGGGGSSGSGDTSAQSDSSGGSSSTDASEDDSSSGGSSGSSGSGGSSNGGVSVVGGTYGSSDEGPPLVYLDQDGENHPLFGAALGTLISPVVLEELPYEATGYSILTDLDGDGISDEQELSNNQFIADYPRIVTRVALPITMEIQYEEEGVTKTHSERIENTDINQTINNSMESRHYTQLNKKTTPYQTKESYSNSGQYSYQYGYGKSKSSSRHDERFNKYYEKDKNDIRVEASYKSSQHATIPNVGGGGSKLKVDGEYEEHDLKVRKGESKNVRDRSKASTLEINTSIANSFASSGMTETTVFEDVNYTDNLDRNGVEYNEDTLKRIRNNFKQTSITDSLLSSGPNSGLVRAFIYFKNTSVNIPVKISNVRATLSFLTPEGTLLPLRTFTLKEEDGVTNFSQAVYGGDEFGPYVIEQSNLNTIAVKNAMEKGYIPQIHIIDYDINPIAETNYAPGVTNLKIIEEVAKGRTATIILRGKGLSEWHRIAALDLVDVAGVTHYSPGITLKKALFNLLRDPIQDGEWNPTTVPDDNLSWKAGTDEHQFVEGVEGDSWNQFATYVKTYEDDFGKEHHIETIKRIKNLTKFNPFNPIDNPTYNPNQRLSDVELYQMRYWYILHNGKYFDGDLNSPIWVGDRYEIVFVDVSDFRRHFTKVNYDPIVAETSIFLNTRWNSRTNVDEFARSVYLGEVSENDAIHLTIDMGPTRKLFDQSISNKEFGYATNFTIDNAQAWTNFHYTLEPAETIREGIPGSFEHSVTGGINGFEVVVTPSANAIEYQLDFCPLPSGSCQSATFNAKTVENDDGVLIVNSQTPIDYSAPNTLIAPLTAGDYHLAISAIGSLYSSEVSTASTNNTSPSEVDLTISDAGSLPNSFNYSVKGLTNKINVKINENPLTEYFEITVEGIANFSSNQFTVPNSEKVTIIGHTGINSIEIETPDGDYTPGLYKVDVIAKNTQGDTPGLVSDSSYVVVEYDQYFAQKVFAPKVTLELAKLGDIDLEVNFNDGSGWRRIKTSSEDIGNNVIDVQATSTVEQAEQTFHLYFEVPDDIYFGGKDSTKLYIRTVAEKKYRDTFWMKPNLDEEGNVIIYDGLSNSNYLSGIYFDKGSESLTSYLETGGNIVDYWINRIDFDATKLENTLNCYHLENNWFDDTGNSWVTPTSCTQTSNLQFVHRNSFDLAKYFFSPLEEKNYRVTAGIANMIAPNPSTKPNQPTFQIHSPKPGTVFIDNLQSTKAQGFEVFYKEIRAEEVDPYESLTVGNGWTPLAVDIETSKFKVDQLIDTYSFVAVACSDADCLSTPKSIASKPLEHQVGGSCPTGSATFNYTGSDQSFLVPDGCTTVSVKLWGAGGASGSGDYLPGGGGGGFVSGDTVTNPGETLTIIVGGGGNSGYWGSGGGGRSAIRRNTTELATAAGGGSAWNGIGGAGGGLIGQIGLGVNSGIGNASGGTQTGGGGGSGAGSAFTGGNSSCGLNGGNTGIGGYGGGGNGGYNGSCGGGGGGGGYYGGGASNVTNGGGGGGSSYVGEMTNTSNIGGSGTSVGNSGDPDYQSGIGAGGTGGSAGGHGLVIISYGP